MIYNGAEAQMPYLSGGQIEQEASTFRKENWGNGFPVDVDAICDGLGIGVVFIPGLKRQFGIDAYTTSDFKMIVVDENCALNNEDRYRFSIAHELGHIVLHKDYYPSNIDSLETYLRNLPELRNGVAERQADLFAGALLVPLEELRDILEGGKKADLGQCMKHFGVSRAVIAKRTRVFLELA